MIFSLVGAVAAFTPTASADSLSGCVGILMGVVDELTPATPNYDDNGCSIGHDPGNCVCEVTCDLEPQRYVEKILGIAENL